MINYYCEKLISEFKILPTSKFQKFLIEEGYHLRYPFLFLFFSDIFYFLLLTKIGNLILILSIYYLFSINKITILLVVYFTFMYLKIKKMEIYKEENKDKFILMENKDDK